MKRKPSRRDVERARDYLEGRGIDTDGWTDEQVISGERTAMDGDRNAAERRIADWIDGYDRDDLGESPDY